jgi:hypothetical protein
LNYTTPPLSFAKADRDLSFHRIEKALRILEKNLHFPNVHFHDLRSGIGTVEVQMH